NSSTWIPDASRFPLLCSRMCSLLLKLKNTSPSASPSLLLSTHTSGDTHVQAQFRESISYSVFITECQRVTITSGAAAADDAEIERRPWLSAPLTTGASLVSRFPPRRLVIRFEYDGLSVRWIPRTIPSWSIRAIWNRKLVNPPLAVKS